MSENQKESVRLLTERQDVRMFVSSVNAELTERRAYVPPKCKVFDNDITVLKPDDRYEFHIHPEARRRLSHIIDNPVFEVLPGASTDLQAPAQYRKMRRIGIVFSGGPAPGGHNVIGGLFDAAKAANPESRVFGFWVGPDGIIENESVELTRERVDAYRNLGGFGLIKTGRTKIDSPQKVALTRETCRDLQLDAIVVVGGDDSNTNAAFLAQELFDDGVQIIGVPKTIDGDIQVRDSAGQVLCAMSFGFHTAAKAFAREVANLCTDSSSDVKYWHICKVMGRVASHLALEVALQTHANMTLIGEDLANYVDRRRLAAVSPGERDFSAYGMTLRHLSRLICNGIVRRAAAGKPYGVIVIPEGVLEFINEIQVFIIKLNTILADYNRTHDIDFHAAFPRLEDKLEYLRRLARTTREEEILPIWNSRDDDLFNDIPAFFQEGLLMERDSHGNFPFSQVETDKVIMGLVRDYLDILKEKGAYKIGIRASYFERLLQRENLDPDRFGPALFRNYRRGEHLLVKESIISLKTLKQELVKEGLIRESIDVPGAVEKVFRKSEPKFKTQVHFYGYDGRGSDPTKFDAIYTYNLGLTAFSLIANGATGQMAAIRNLDLAFDRWEPIGIPIAPLMHLEERKGKLELVIEKSLVDTDSVAFRVVAEMRETWLAAYPEEDPYRRPGPIKLSGTSRDERPLTLHLNSLTGC